MFSNIQYLAYLQLLFLTDINLFKNSPFLDFLIFAMFCISKVFQISI